MKRLLAVSFIPPCRETRGVNVAADMEPQSSLAAFGGNGSRIGLDDEGRVALSPIYAAPEVFVEVDRSPLNFDSFSAALVFAQVELQLCFCDESFSCSVLEPDSLFAPSSFLLC